MKSAKLFRLHDNGRQTVGIFIAYESGHPIHVFMSIERAWVQNQRLISCIPNGLYYCKFRTIGQYANSAYEVTNVQNRTAILIHAGNFVAHTAGCILLGEKFSDINNDGELDITQSKNAIQTMISFFNKEDFMLHIS